MAFKKTPQTPEFRTPAESADITGGIGYAGLAEVQRFVDSGGCWLRWERLDAGSGRRNCARRAPGFRGAAKHWLAA